MDWKDLSTTIAKAAPLVGTLIGGPAGTAIGGLVSAALGVSNDPESVSAAVANDPDAVVKLKQLELDHKLQMQQLAVAAEQNRLNAANALQVAQLSADTALVQSKVTDVASARAMQVANKSRMPAVLAILAIALGTATFAGVLLDLFPALHNPGIAVTVGMVLGAVIAEFKNAFAFYLGGVAEPTASPLATKSPKADAPGGQ